MSKKQDKIDYWFNLAKYDLKTADVMLENKRYIYVGFMCHQVIEKSLKGYYVYKIKKIPPFTHNLSYLAEQNKIYDNLSDEQKSIIDQLEPLNIEARYPTYKERTFKTLNSKKCREIFKQTKELYIWIKKKLSE